MERKIRFCIPYLFLLLAAAWTLTGKFERSTLMMLLYYVSSIYDRVETAHEDSREVA